MERFSTPITFVTEDGTTTHAPMVLADVGGIATRLICDTGASEHVLTLDLARRAGAALSPDEPGTDAAGDAVPSWRLGQLSARVGDWTLSLDGAPVAQGPPPFEGWGIGGFLSPQALHPSGLVVLDLAAGNLAFTDDSPETVAGVVAQRHPALRPIQLARDPSDTTLLVRAAIDGYPEVLTLLDSGARSTSFAEDAVPGLTGGAEAVSGRGLAGREIRAPVVEGARLRVADAVLPIGSLFVTPEAHGVVQGVIGMDLLRGTVLVLAADVASPVTWFVPR
jgi:hypothetical protein